MRCQHHNEWIVVGYQAFVFLLRFWFLWRSYFALLYVLKELIILLWSSKHTSTCWVILHQLVTFVERKFYVMNWRSSNILHRNFSIWLRLNQLHIEFRAITEIPKIQIWNNFSFCVDIDGESAANSILAIDFNLATHLLYHAFTNAQAETCALSVILGVLIQLAKLHKQLRQIFFLYSYSRINDFYFHFHKFFITTGYIIPIWIVSIFTWV